MPQLGQRLAASAVRSGSASEPPCTLPPTCAVGAAPLSHVAARWADPPDARGTNPTGISVAGRGARAMPLFSSGRCGVRFRLQQQQQNTSRAKSSADAAIMRYMSAPREQLTCPEGPTNGTAMHWFALSEPEAAQVPAQPPSQTLTVKVESDEQLMLAAIVPYPSGSVRLSQSVPKLWEKKGELSHASSLYRSICPANNAHTGPPVSALGAVLVAGGCGGDGGDGGAGADGDGDGSGGEGGGEGGGMHGDSPHVL